MNEYTITMPQGTVARISWLRDAAWGQHWSVSHGGTEVARHATFTEARRAVERAAASGPGGWPL
jgi:hypothetical protein